MPSLAIIPMQAETALQAAVCAIPAGQPVLICTRTDKQGFAALNEPPRINYKPKTRLFMHKGGHVPRSRPIYSEMKEQASVSSNFVEALARGLKIMSLFNGERGQLSPSDLARIVDLPRATVRRTLLTLNQLGYVDTDGKRFWLTPAVLDLAAAYLRSSGVPTFLQPLCDTVGRELNAMASVAILSGDQAVVVARSNPAQIFSDDPGVGLRVPVYYTAIGRVLLSSLSDKELDNYFNKLQPEQITPYTIVSKTGIREAVESVRRNGYAIADQEADVGYRTMAVPLRRYDNAIIAALSVSVRIETASIEALKENYLPCLLRESDTLRGRLFS